MILKENHGKICGHDTLLTWIKRILIQLVRARDTTNISKTSEIDPKLLRQRKDKNLKKKNSTEKCMWKNKRRKITYEIELIKNQKKIKEKKMSSHKTMMEKKHRKRHHQTKEKLYLITIRIMMRMKMVIVIKIESE